MQSVPKRHAVSNRPRPRLLSTGDVAKELDVCRDWVLRLAEHGALAFELTVGGQLIFHRAEVDRFNLQRDHERSRSRAEVLTAIHLRMIKAAIEPQQLSFLHGVGLRIVARGERAVGDRRLKVARTFEEISGSDMKSSVNRKVAGSRR